MFSSVTVSIMILDKDQKIIRINESMKTNLYIDSDVIGGKLNEFKSNDS